MRLEEMVLTGGLILYLGFLAFGFFQARKVERDYRPIRIGISSWTQYLDYANLVLSFVWMLLFTFTLTGEFAQGTNWLLAVIFLSVSLQSGFPRGILVPPGLVHEGLFYMGSLYRWDFFSHYEVRSTDKIRLNYKNPSFGLRGLTVRVSEEDTQRFLSRLTENGISSEKGEQKQENSNPC